MTNGNTYEINKQLNEREDFDALQEVTTELEQAEARIEELEAAIKRQASASKKLRSFDLERTQHLEAIDRSEYTAAKTLDSERHANEILTHRIEELEAKLSKSEALLAKAVEAERVYCANVVKHFYDNGFFTKPDDNINRTTLAELKGHLICLKPLE
jgi:BMFP domain-containing protein YqiC